MHSRALGGAESIVNKDKIGAKAGFESYFDDGGQQRRCETLVRDYESCSGLCGM